MTIELGSLLLDRYRVVRYLWREGLGDVYRAEHAETGEAVTVKVLGPPVSRLMGAAQASSRFRQEAEASARLRSPYLLPLREVDEDDIHGPVLVFAGRDGDLLINHLRRTGPMPLAALKPLLTQLWLALIDLHKSGVLHRDISPYNLLVDQQESGGERLTVLNLGSCKLPLSMGGEELTQFGQSIGEFAFMPPEQIGKAKTVDHRADIYSATTVIFQALCGQLPFNARNLLLLVEMKTRGEPRRLSEILTTPVDPELEEFTARGLARDPEGRFGTAEEALAAFRALGG
jgi:eukaryotic-like serine/threonine-protein kinase